MYTQRVNKKNTVAIIKKLLKRNPSVLPQEVSFELRFQHQIAVSDRTISRYISSAKKELAADKPKPKPVPKPILPKKSESLGGISCPLCHKICRFDNPNPIALIGCCGGGNGEDNHVMIHYDRQTREWRYVHNNAPLVAESPPSVVGFVAR